VVHQAIARPLIRATNLFWERRLGIDTRGIAAQETWTNERGYYSTGPYLRVRAVLRHLNLGPDDFFVDVGCGKGRVICLVARHPIRGVEGIEISEDLLADARRNVAALRGKRAPVTLTHAPAESADYARAAVLYFASPFGPETLQKVLGRVQATRDGKIRLAYVNPVHDDVLQATPWLRRTSHWGPDGRFALGVAVSFWSSD
jgi:SAM-dependent methyltransferase